MFGDGIGGAPRDNHPLSIDSSTARRPVPLGQLHRHYNEFNVRILICTSDTPLHPVNTGYRRQLMGMVPELSKSNEVRLIGYRFPEQSTTPAVDVDMRVIPYARPSTLRSLGDLAAAFTLRRPVRAARLSAGLRGPLREEIERFKPDVVHIGPGKLAGLLPDLGGLPCVLGVMDAWHLNVDARAEAARGIRKPLFRLDAHWVRRFEATRYRGFGRVVPSNEGDRDELRALDPALPFMIIPIGFDASAYAPDPTAKVDRNRIMFHGAMDYAPNVTAVQYLAEQILPLVRAQHAEAHLVLVGRDPAPKVVALGALAGVTVIGPVEDMRSWITGSRVWAGPFLSGTGIKTKLLEAMATDIPCVVTPLGHRGLDDITSGTQLLVGTTPRELADHLLSVLKDDEFAERLGCTGGEYVRPKYDWPAVGKVFEEVYETVIAEKKSEAFKP
jgi:polysaccharide biosynthesis protein PslH